MTRTITSRILKMLLTLAVLLQCLVAEAAHGYYGGNSPIHSGGFDKLFGQIILACCALPILSRLLRFGPWKDESWYETCTFAVLMPLALTLAFQVAVVAIFVIPIYLAYKIYTKATKPKSPTKTTEGGSQKANAVVASVPTIATEVLPATSQSQAVSWSSPQSPAPSWPSPPQQQSVGGPIKWGWVIVLLMLLAAGISTLGSGDPPPKGFQPPSAPSQHPTPPSTPSADTLSPLSEELPPVGRNKILRREQILYCLSQEMRLSSMRAILNAGSPTELAKFNAAIADYNRRCGYFRYYARVMQAAREEVEPHREALRAEGSQTVYKWRQ